jgi:K+-transporting ATPase ATPase C chain
MSQKTIYKSTAQEEHADRHSNPSFLRATWASIAMTITLGIICCGAYPLIIWGVGQTLFANKANGSLLDKNGNPTNDASIAVGSALIGQNFSDPKYFHPRPSAAGNGYDPTSSGGSNLGPLSDKLINGQTTPATTQPTTQPESLAFDGIRLRTIHYAVDNGIAFKLCQLNPDGTRTPVPLSNFQDGKGNLNDVALVDAFPHPPSDTADKKPLIAADFATPIPGDAVTASASGLDPHISPRNAELQAQRVAGARNIPVAKVKGLITQYTEGPDLGILGDAGVNVLKLNLALDNLK